jgi:hypothetical protein
LNRLKAEAVHRRVEIEKLYRLSDAISSSDNVDAIVERLSASLLEILGVDAVAVHDKAVGRILRSGQGEQIGEEQLREVAASGHGYSNPESGLSILPIREGGVLAGSIGVAGAGVSPLMLKAIAGKAGIAIARARA